MLVDLEVHLGRLRWRTRAEITPRDDVDTDDEPAPAPDAPVGFTPNPAQEGPAWQ